jgi:hypothetical protein
MNEQQVERSPLTIFKKEYPEVYAAIRAEERERCARLAECKNYGVQFNSVCRDIASAIRELVDD